MAEQGVDLKAPHWGWPIVLDFFVSGMAAGAYVTATLALLAGGGRDAPAVRAGYLLASPLISLSLVLLILDLGLPRRFLHMILSRKATGGIGWGALTVGDIHFKPFSPMSVGAWGLSIFGAFAFASLVLVWIAPGWGGRPLLVLLGVLGASLALFAGGYKGVLLRATAQPVWAASRWLGPLFLAASLSSGVAAVGLTANLLGADASAQRLAGALAVALVLEGLLLAIWLWDLGAERKRLSRLGLWEVRIGAGLFLPLGFLAAGWLNAAALLALLGGLTFRRLVIAAATAPAPHRELPVPRP
jgi:formate-dependent nitrite reductase membrane component NrfD